jgi:hypothetical protein
MYFLYNSFCIRGISKDIEIEGPGAAYYRILTLYAFCNKHNFEYLHYKINIGHNYDNYDDNVWDEKWDNFFNMKKISKLFQNIDTNDYNILKKHGITDNDVQYFIENSDKKEIIYIHSPCDVFFKKNISEYFKPIQDKIIEAYQEANINRPLIYNKDHKNIAIHIRVWNDCDAVCETYERYLYSIAGRYAINENGYAFLINKLHNKYPDANIHIFSQKSFKNKYPNIYNTPNINFHFDMDAFDTFHHLVNADILVPGLSCYSHVAALYNKNQIIYIDYEPLPKLIDTWINLNEL